MAPEGRTGVWFRSPGQTPAVLCGWNTAVAAGLGIPLFSFWKRSTLKELLLFFISLKDGDYYYLSHNALTIIVATDVHRRISSRRAVQMPHFYPRKVRGSPAWTRLSARCSSSLRSLRVSVPCG